MDDLAVSVGEQPGPRVVSRDGPGQTGEMGHRRLHVHRVEGAGDAERDEPGSVGGFAARAANCSVVPAATIWPVPLLFAAVKPWASSAASTSSG